jgi:hypothetical protein
VKKGAHLSHFFHDQHFCGLAVWNKFQAGPVEKEFVAHIAVGWRSWAETHIIAVWSLALLSPVYVPRSQLPVVWLEAIPTPIALALP